MMKLLLLSCYFTLFLLKYIINNANSHILLTYFLYIIFCHMRPSHQSYNKPPGCHVIRLDWETWSLSLSVPQHPPFLARLYLILVD